MTVRRGLIKREVLPGVDVADDAIFMAYCRNRDATIFHPSGNCAIPTLVSGKNHAPVVMLAEKAVDVIQKVIQILRLSAVSP